MTGIVHDHDDQWSKITVTTSRSTILSKSSTSPLRKIQYSCVRFR